MSALTRSLRSLRSAELNGAPADRQSRLGLRAVLFGLHPTSGACGAGVRPQAELSPHLHATAEVL